MDNKEKENVYIVRPWNMWEIWVTKRIYNLLVLEQENVIVHLNCVVE